LGRQSILLFRAISSASQSGINAFIVPLCNARFQPTNGFLNTTHSDGSPFSDESEYVQGDCEASVAAVASRGAMEMAINVVRTGKPIIGGEWLSIDHPTMRHRAYNIWNIIDNGSGNYTVKFSPPLREDISIGETVELSDPKCVMHVVGDMRAAPVVDFASGDVLLCEDFAAPYS